jgi:hypothetical protein
MSPEGAKRPGHEATSSTDPEHGQSGSPLVSIVVRTRNRPLGLREALASLAAQTWPALEVVVVNDGGTPVRSLVEEALAPTASAWTLVEWPDNRGRERAGNAGLATARGEYLGFLDDDDVLYPEHVSVLMAHFAAHPDARVGYTDAYQATQEPDASAASGYRTLSRELVLSWDVNPEEFRRQNWIPLHCVLFHRACLAAVGGLDETLRRLEDWDFLLRLSWRFPMAHLKRVTAEYRHRTDHPRLADPLGFGSTPAYLSALERIRGKQPDRDAFAGAGGGGGPAPDERSGPARRWWSSLRP